jgi:radical SAM superfamily enzyme YgiQ (UPF0313 family)
MKTLLIGINSKYIHPNLAIRYLKANTTYPVEIIEFTIKDTVDDIVDQCLSKKPDNLGFSVYIWNVEMVKRILYQIRKKEPSIHIILGGPEVSYINESYFTNNLTDFIICNEGEIAFHQLLDAINHRSDLSNISNLIYKDGNNIIKNKQKMIENLDELKDPYHVIPEKDIQHKIQYVELSRGCPYKCSYCLASLEKGLRFFSIERVINQIDSLVQNGAKTFKFLDRSFNANHKLAQTFLEHLIHQNYKDVVFQFEINADVLKRPFIDFLIDNVPENLIRFEIGIQSTNDRVNQAVNRYQNTTKLIQNIQLLQQSNIIMHLDLIAGLPYEDLDSFKNTFNTIYQLFADELQLGFLKVLKGTEIYHKANQYQLNYHKEAPYEIIDNQFITEDELKIIHQVETMLNIYWNKGFMKRSMIDITKDRDAFEFFLQLFQYFKKNQLDTLRYSFNDLFVHLIDFLKENHMFNHQIESHLKYDFLNHHPIKPKIYWSHPANKNDILRDFYETNQSISIDNLYKYAIVTEYLKGYLIIIYKYQNKQIHYFEKSQRKNSP